MPPLSGKQGVSSQEEAFGQMLDMLEIPYLTTELGKLGFRPWELNKVTGKCKLGLGRQSYTNTPMEIKRQRIHHVYPGLLHT